MFKADQVDNLKAELAGGAAIRSPLGLGFGAAPIGLADSRTSPLSGSGISLADTDFGKSPGGGHGEGRHGAGGRPRPVGHSGGHPVAGPRG